MMKKYFLTILSFFTVSCCAQNTVNINTFNMGDNYNKYFKDFSNYRQKFVGTWESTVGDTTFRIILHKTNNKPMGYPVEYYKDVLEGKFLIIKNLGTANEIVLHDSEKTYPNGNTTVDVISATAGESRIAGSFEDPCASGGDDFLDGFFKLVIINPNSLPLQAQWTIKRDGTTIEGRYYSMPKDALMTKVTN